MSVIISNLRGTRESVFGLRPAGTAGAPLVGTFTIGELWLDSNGVYWCCTAPGSPGTWVQLRGGGNVWPKPGKANIGAVEYSTITLAAAAAVSGDTILVGAGTYTEDVTIPSGVSLIGNGRRSTLIAGTLTFSGGTQSMGGLEMTYSVSSGSMVSLVTAAGDLDVVNCVLTVANSGAGGHRAIRIDGSGRLLVETSEIIATGAGGVGVSYNSSRTDSIIRESDIDAGSMMVEEVSSGTVILASVRILGVSTTSGTVLGTFLSTVGNFGNTNLSANKAMETDGSKRMVTSNVSSTELSYLSGVTSALQTQLNAKLASASYTAADVLSKLLTVDGAASGVDADTVDGSHASAFAAFVHSHKASPNLFSGRLTLTSGNAVPTADQLAKTSLIFTPYDGDELSLYDGSASWEPFTLTEISASLSGLTANAIYDAFIYYNSGLALDLTAWASASARATALTLQNGVLVKSGTPTRRYVGSILLAGTTGQCEDSALRRGVWNYRNRRKRHFSQYIGVSSYAYTTAAWRQWNADTTAQVDFVVGVVEDSVLSIIGGNIWGGAGYLSLGLNSTTGTTPSVRNGNASMVEGGQSRDWIPALGKNTVYAVQYGAAGTNFGAVSLTGHVLG